MVLKKINHHLIPTIWTLHVASHLAGQEDLELENFGIRATLRVRSHGDIR